MKLSLSALLAICGMTLFTACVQPMDVGMEDDPLSEEADPALDTQATSGVIKCCTGQGSTGAPASCHKLFSGDGCEDGYYKAWCPSEHSHPSNCQYIPPQ